MSRRTESLSSSLPCSRFWTNQIVPRRLYHFILNEKFACKLRDKVYMNKILVAEQGYLRRLLMLLSKRLHMCSLATTHVHDCFQRHYKVLNRNLCYRQWTIRIK
jgi:hypothetical protein